MGQLVEWDEARRAVIVLVYSSCNIFSFCRRLRWHHEHLYLEPHDIYRSFERALETMDADNKANRTGDCLGGFVF